MPTATDHTFAVQGMSCAHCERAITQAILALDPQAKIRVQLAEGQVLVSSQQPREALAGAIRDEGYTVLA